MVQLNNLNPNSFWKNDLERKEHFISMLSSCHTTKQNSTLKKYLTRSQYFVVKNRVSVFKIIIPFTAQIFQFY